MKWETIWHKAEESGNAGVTVYDLLPCLVFSEFEHQKLASRLNTIYCSILVPLLRFPRACKHMTIQPNIPNLLWCVPQISSLEMVRYNTVFGF